MHGVGQGLTFGAFVVMSVVLPGCCGGASQAPAPPPGVADVTVFYVEEGERRVTPAVDLQLTLEPGGGLRNADGRAIGDAQRLAELLEGQVSTTAPASPLVLDLFAGGVEAERRISAADIARAVDQIRVAAELAGPGVPARTTIHVHSALLTEARLSRTRRE